MSKIGLFEKLINYVGHKALLTLTGLLTLILLSTPISTDKKFQFKSKGFEISFDSFSPAFAAFEDDFLFEEGSETIGQDLMAGQSDEIYNQLTADQKDQVVETTVVTAKTQKSSSLMDQFDGSIAIHEIAASQSASRKKIAAPKKTQTAVQEEELRSGSLFAMVNNGSIPSMRPVVTNPGPETFQPQAPVVKEPGKVNSNNHIDDEIETPEVDYYNISGSILLREGLAFIGSMEVSWVVGDHELQVGSINVPDATFEIEVSKLVGDIIVSLYDDNDELIGEGIFNLNQIQAETDSIATTIEVHPIDWDEAGQVVHADSLGTGVRKAVEGAEVALYAFNDATLSKKDGSFSFYNWKKINSRTLAIASKEGFKDSIFMLDSKKGQSVLLFTDKYMESFFKYIEGLGIHDVVDKGTVYGQVTGVADRSGYSIQLKGAKALYFIPLGLASSEIDKTTSNGLFSFVGLQDGDYQITVEKDGEILDEKLVAVEQGKVSPVLFNLSTTYKHIEFYDPLNPDKQISKVDVSFFDGSTTQVSLDRDNMSRVAITSSGDPGVLEINTIPNNTRTMLSHNKGLQKIPFIQDSKLLSLASSNKMKIEEGLIIGFIQSDVKFRAAIVENPEAKTLYFDEKGRVVDPIKTKAHGFIIGGFPEGLSSILIDSVEEGTILGSDLVFSDHHSVSVVQLDLLPIN